MITPNAICCLIALGGRTGAGKTTLAYALRKGIPCLAHALIVGNDETRRALLGIPLHQDMPPEAYTAEVSARVEEDVYRQMESALNQGQSVISHAGYFGPAGQKRIQDFARNVPFSSLGLWLDVSEKTLIQRVQERLDARAQGVALSIEAGHASDADLVVLLEKFKDMRAPDDPFWRKIDADKPLPALIQEIEAFLQIP